VEAIVALLNSTKKLNAQEQAFVDEYLIDLKPYDAAIAAGYAETTAKTKAYLWVSNSKCPKNKRHVLRAIAKAKIKRSERTNISADYVLNRLVQIDQMDVLDILEEDGSMKLISEWPKVWRTTLSALDISEIWGSGGDERAMVGVLRKIKWPDKVKNLELLGKHVDVQAFKDKIEHSGEIDMSGPLAAARKRIEKRAE
jgi:phage terminase small subunit